MTMKEQSYVVTMRDCIGAMLLTSFVKFTYIAIGPKKLARFTARTAGIADVDLLL